VFRGFSTISLDAKGRLAIPRRYRDRLLEICNGSLILTLNPLDRCLWLYPLPEWQSIEAKLQALTDFDRRSRRTKQMMRGYANECGLDSQNRVLLPQKLREFASLEKSVVFLGQGNKFEIWDEGTWNRGREEWLQQLDAGDEESSRHLNDLSL
jgi:MraZ protein